MTFEQRMYNSLKRKGLAPKFEHAGIYAILLDREIVYIGKWFLEKYAQVLEFGVENQTDAADSALSDFSLKGAAA